MKNNNDIYPPIIYYEECDHLEEISEERYEMDFDQIAKNYDPDYNYKPISMEFYDLVDSEIKNKYKQSLREQKIKEILK